MTEENIKLEENLENAQRTEPDEPAVETVEVKAAEETAAETVEVKAVEEAAAETVEAKEEKPVKEKKVKQPKEKKEKKPCKLVSFFANAKNAGDLTVKCFLMMLIAAVLAYVLGLMFWGMLDKLIPTFFNGAYWAVGTAAAFLLAGVILVIVMIARYNRNKKKK